MTKPKIDMELNQIRRDSPTIQRLERRLFLKQGLSLGVLALLGGCDMTNAERVQKMLSNMSRWNDQAQAFLFNPNKLAPTYPESAITDPFPFNAFYDEPEAPMVNPATWRLELSGMIQDRKPWTLMELHMLPQES